MPEDEVSRTKQSFKDECDIRNILKKFQKTGIIEHARRYGGEYGVAHAVDFKTAMDIVARGKSMWESLPSSLKKRFASPEAFVAFAHDDKNIEEARELGLIPPKEDDVPPKAVDKPAKPVDVPKEAKPTEGD
jgi:phage internal scaffolding protein